jgi:hypothetical protein
MPRGDRTGPQGYGPMTGRGVGYCAGRHGPGYVNPAYGWGRGWGRGWRHRHWARFGYGPGPAWDVPPAYGPYAQPPTREDEAAYLRDQADWLQEQLNAVQARLDELEQEA